MAKVSAITTDALVIMECVRVATVITILADMKTAQCVDINKNKQSSINKIILELFLKIHKEDLFDSILIIRVLL